MVIAEYIKRLTNSVKQVAETVVCFVVHGFDPAHENNIEMIMECLNRLAVRGTLRDQRDQLVQALKRLLQKAEFRIAKITVEPPALWMLEDLVHGERTAEDLLEPVGDVANPLMETGVQRTPTPSIGEYEQIIASSWCVRFAVSTKMLPDIAEMFRAMVGRCISCMQDGAAIRRFDQSNSVSLAVVADTERCDCIQHVWNRFDLLAGERFGTMPVVPILR